MNTTRATQVERLVSRLARHGALRVSMRELLTEGQIIWTIGQDQELSAACVHAEEFMSSAARDCRQANALIARMRAGQARKDPVFMTALKKYVQDACAAIKEVDDELKRNGSSLEALLFEIPGESGDRISWRGLIGRRDVIAHQLLTVDDNRIYREAERDFGLLHQLISAVYFAPIKTDLRSSPSPQPLIQTKVLKNLTPVEPGEPPRIGNSLVLIFEDATDGFVWVRVGRTHNNKVALATSRPMQFAVAGVNRIDAATDDQGPSEAVGAADDKA